MKTNIISKTKSIFAIALIILSMSACRYGNNDPIPLNRSNLIIEEVIPLNNFDKIEIGSAFDVFVKRGNNFSIVAKGDENDIQDLEASVNNGKLRIRYRNNASRRFEMKIFITMPRLVEANFYGAAFGEITNFNENKIIIRASGASDLFVDADSKFWQVDLSGASKLELIGEGQSLILDASGASNLHASQLFLDEVDLDVSGSSRIWVFAYDEIFGRASGASAIRFRGNPFVDIKLSGSSWVEKN